MHYNEVLDLSTLLSYQWNSQKSPIIILHFNALANVISEILKFRSGKSLISFFFQVKCKEEGVFW